MSTNWANRGLGFATRRGGLSLPFLLLTDVQARCIIISDCGVGGQGRCTMPRVKESRATYSAEPITVVTTRGTTEIPRALRECYRVTAKSRLRWTDTGNGLLIVPVESPSISKIGMRRVADPAPTYKSPRQSKRAFLVWLDEWMQEPDDWTPEQWDEFERELRANRVKFRDIEI